MANQVFHLSNTGITSGQKFYLKDEVSGIFLRNLNIDSNFPVVASNLVYNTGNQIISGNKTFNDRLIAKTGFFGENNLLSGAFLAIAGGINNFISGNNSFIGGGSTNRISGNNNFIGGGSNNIVNRGSNSSIVAGSANSVDINSNCSFIGGGASNRTISNACLSVIGGGFSNCTACNGAVIGGGCTNRAFGDGAVVVGGCGNTASRPGGFVGGGCTNCVESYASTIGGGFNNWSSLGSCNFIGGGGGNQARNDFSTVGGGQLNYAFSLGASILGGLTSQIDDNSNTSSIVGGCANRISYTLGGTIGGGRFNCIESSPNAVIGGGCLNIICRAANSYIVGGYLSNILVDHSGSAILADGQNRVHNSYSSNSLTLDFASGVYFSDKKIFGFVPEMVEVRNNFLISGNFNSDVIIANSATQITGTLVSGNPIGFNTSIIQRGAGQVQITGSGIGIIINSYNNQYKTAGQFAAISLLHTGNNIYMMYGNTAL